MLQFFSSSNAVVNTKRAVDECLENALGVEDTDCDLLIFKTTMGHNFEELLEQFHERAPSAQVVGCTGSGIIGNEGPSESLRSLAVMAIRGPDKEFAVSALDSVIEIDSFEAGAAIAADLKNKNPEISMVHFLPASFDIYPGDRAIAGIESVFGSSMPIFGGCALDSTNWHTSFQFIDNRIIERGAVAVGFADPSLAVAMQADHGYDTVGDPFIVTRSDANRIYELDGKPAWEALRERAGLPEDVDPMSTDAAALWAIAVEIPEEFHEAYGNPCMVILGGPLRQPDGSIVAISETTIGTKLWMTQRNEDRIFGGVDRIVEGIKSQIEGRELVAVFHADCAARGRLLFNKILKHEIVSRMQIPLFGSAPVPWIGLYCGGEFCKIGERNWFHGYTTAIFALYRREE